MITYDLGALITLEGEGLRYDADRQRSGLFCHPERNRHRETNCGRMQRIDGSVWEEDADRKGADFAAAYARLPAKVFWTSIIIRMGGRFTTTLSEVRTPVKCEKINVKIRTFLLALFMIALRSQRSRVGQIVLHDG